MLKRFFLLLPFLIAGGVVLGGAWPNSPAPVPPPVQTPFVPQTFTLAEDVAGAAVTARELLERAVANLAPDRVAWLNTKIGQTMTDGESSFVANGILLRGPNGCARLELNVKTAGVSSRLLVVCDGEILAEERRVHNADPVIVCKPLPAAADSTPSDDGAAREAYLAAKNCGGPSSILRELQGALRSLQHRTGLLEEHPVIEIRGDLTATEKPLSIRTSIPLRDARIYLDAKNLWPGRIELWGTDKSQTPNRVVKIEFLDPAINREMPLEECVRAFSYQPEPTKKAKPR